MDKYVWKVLFKLKGVLSKGDWIQMDLPISECAHWHRHVFFTSNPSERYSPLLPQWMWGIGSCPGVFEYSWGLMSAQCDTTPEPAEMTNGQSVVGQRSTPHFLGTAVLIGTHFEKIKDSLDKAQCQCSIEIISFRVFILVKYHSITRPLSKARVNCLHCFVRAKG
jgi:hypothetical protein